MFWKIVKFLLLLPFALITAYLIFVIGLGFSLLPLAFIFSTNGFVIAFICIVIFFVGEEIFKYIQKNKVLAQKSKIQTEPMPISEIICLSLSPILYLKKEQISETKDGFTKSIALSNMHFSALDKISIGTLSTIGTIWINTKEFKKNESDDIGSLTFVQDNKIIDISSSKNIIFRVTPYVDLYVSSKLYNIILNDVKKKKYVKLVLGYRNGVITNIFEYEIVSKKIIKDYLFDFLKKIPRDHYANEFEKAIKEAISYLDLPSRTSKNKLKTPRRARA
jgi:hypothetical protein